MLATRVFTARGQSLLVEYGGTVEHSLPRCWDSEEISEVDVDIEDGDDLYCEICGEIFTEKYDEELDEYIAITSGDDRE